MDGCIIGSTFVGARLLGDDPNVALDGMDWVGDFERKVRRRRSLGRLVVLVVLPLLVVVVVVAV